MRTIVQIIVLSAIQKVIRKFNDKVKRQKIILKINKKTVIVFTEQQK